MLQLIKIIWNASNALAHIVYSFVMSIGLLIGGILLIFFLSIQCVRQEARQESTQLKEELKTTRFQRDSFFYVAQEARDTSKYYQQEYRTEYFLRVKAETAQQDAERMNDAYKVMLVSARDSNKVLTRNLANTRQTLDESQLLLVQAQTEKDSISTRYAVLTARYNEQAEALAEQTIIAQRVIYSEANLLQARRYLILCSCSLLLIVFLSYRFRYATTPVFNGGAWLSAPSGRWQRFTQSMSDWYQRFFNAFS